MKKLMFFATLLLAIGITSACANNEKPVDATQLPPAAQQFIKTYFPNETISFAMVDKEILDTQYDVYLSNRTELEFNKNGEWKDVDCKSLPVPAGIVPETIVAYVAQHFPNVTIVKINRDRRDYEIELYPGEIELVFNLDGSFKRIDD